MSRGIVAPLLPVAILAAMLAPLFQAAPASACSCSQLTPEQFVALPGVTNVLRGTVDRTARERGTGRVEYVIAASEVWRGDTGAYFNVLDWVGCGANLSTGSEYVLGFGPSPAVTPFPEDAEHLLTMCSLHVPVSGALPAELAFLGPGTPVARGPDREPGLMYVNEERNAGLQAGAVAALVGVAAVALAGIAIGLARRV